jgi:hypothetical protein
MNTPGTTMIPSAPRRGGRGGSGRGDQQKNKAIFKGSTPEMNNNVFECYDEQSDRRQYAKTLEALEGYAKKNLATIPSEFTQIFLGKHSVNIMSKSLRPRMPEYPFTQIFLGKNSSNIIIN